MYVKVLRNITFVTYNYLFRNISIYFMKNILEICCVKIEQFQKLTCQRVYTLKYDCKILKQNE